MTIPLGAAQAIIVALGIVGVALILWAAWTLTRR